MLMNYRKDLYDTSARAEDADQLVEIEEIHSPAAPALRLSTPIGSNTQQLDGVRSTFGTGTSLSTISGALRSTRQMPQGAAKYLDFMAELYKTMPPGETQATSDQNRQVGTDQTRDAPQAVA